ncbi:MAG: WD40 repeat domain-containing protein [Cyanobacteria bacterium J06632_22]
MKSFKLIAGSAVLGTALAACNSDGESRLDLLDSCISGRASEAYPQSDNIQCLHRLDTGSTQFQSSASTREVQFASDSQTLYTLSTYVQQWQMADGSEIPPDTPVNTTDLEGGGDLHYSPSRGYVGFSQGSRVYTDIVPGTPLLESDGSGYRAVTYIEGLDAFVGYGLDGDTLYFYNRTTGDLMADQPITPNINRVVGGRDSYATALSDFRIVVWPIAETQSGLVLAGHEAKVVEITYSDDETQLTSVDAKGTIIVWDLATGKLQHQFQTEMSQAVPAATVAFSPNGQLLATNGQGPEITFWSLKAGETMAQITIAKFGILDLDISPDGSKLAVGLSWGGRYDQNARRSAQETVLDPNLLEAGPAVIFDITDLQP